MKKPAKPSLINPKARRKEQMRRGKLIFLIIVALAVIQLIASHQRILAALGRYLVYHQPPQQADVIFILANWDDTIVRARAGADLYKNGLAKTVFIPRMERMKGHEEIAQRGITIPENRDLLITILQGFGVPLVAIETSGQEVTDTWDEAREASQFIEAKGYTTVLLVTSKYHARRAYLIFKDALKGKATVISVPSPYDSSDPEVWWKQNEDATRVIMEYQKLLVYWWRKVF
jgi:uncharacterized SAM-binding protein YcdF (DUF218 family)